MEAASVVPLKTTLDVKELELMEKRVAELEKYLGIED